MRAMFQFVLSEGEDVEERLARLEEAGVAVDRKFGAIAVNSREHKFVARGEVDPETLDRLREAGEVEVFGDRKIAPTSGEEE